MGENIYSGSAKPSPDSVVGLWASERSDYDFGTVLDGSNYQIFGHYTQVVWGASTDLGCGYANCGGSSKFLVCRYGPAGNFISRTPYDSATGACLDLDNDDAYQMHDVDDTDRNQ